jgi:hypothetical protein
MRISPIGGSVTVDGGVHRSAGATVRRGAMGRKWNSDAIVAEAAEWGERFA